MTPLNIGLSSAWKKATIWENWRSVVDVATLKRRKRITLNSTVTYYKNQGG